MDEHKLKMQNAKLKINRFLDFELLVLNFGFSRSEV
jgi:hypothetical protein